MNYEVVINEDDAIVVIFRDWLLNRLHLIPGYDKYCYTLDGIYYSLSSPSAPMVYERPIIKIFGYEGPTPRDQFACGNSEISAHNYTGTSVPMHDWHNSNNPTIDGIRCIGELISQDPVLMQLSHNCVPNSCLVNYYRDGNDYVGFHADKELKDPMQTVFTITLGQARPFQLKHKTSKRTITTVPNPGDLVIMTGNTQKLWKHSIPKRANTGGRVSLTYRVL